MTETRVVIACVECRVHWDETAAPICANPAHTHRSFAVHRHRSVVVLPDGTGVTAVSFGGPNPYAREQPPDFGLYLDRRWQPPWACEYLDWPDFGVPEEPSRVVAVLRSLLERAQAGERVEVGCLGGHGRTGTALAVLAVLCGHPASEAVTWVRANYCSAAVETTEQEMFVSGLSG